MSQSEPGYILHFEKPQPLKFIIVTYGKLDFRHCGKIKSAAKNQKHAEKMESWRS